MRRILLLIPIIILTLVDLFLFNSFRQYTVTKELYIGISIISYGALLLLILLRGSPSHNRTKFQNILIGIAIATIIAKLLCLPIALIGRALLLISSSSIISTVMLLLYIIPLVVLISMLYGVFWGRYRYQVEEIVIESKDLPAAFDGFRIAQISDIHSGTWDDAEQVDQAVQHIQDQQPDLILFTGDLVNSHKDEIDPYIRSFARLYAPAGKYAVLGNHDYVGLPRNEPTRSLYWQDFLDKFRQMGFDLLLNESRLINWQGGQIALVGVENWGNSPYFPQKGDLNKALLSVPTDNWRLLISHDPSHWEEHVRQHPTTVHLTLSGHTHGMQWGINTRWLKWSPVQYQYPHWMGLYQEGDRQLYVNRGFGMLAFPGRVGMSSEITMLTLKRKDEQSHTL